MWAINDHLNALRQCLSQEVKDHAKYAAGTTRSEFDKLYTRLKALQAIDVDYSFHDTGKIIIIARIGEKHIVKIIDIQPCADMTEYKQMSKAVAGAYGVRNVRADTPWHTPTWADYDRA